MRISWRQWKLGFFVALLLSLFVALAGLTAGMHWQAFLAVFGAAGVTHFGAFLTQHPPEQVSFDTELRTNQPKQQNNDDKTQN